ncbi:MAG TPA: hypothetical protein VNJ04_03780 [Gemmatimonadaceae bacterium]|nr:hypothetical protein [Gemmatimonadaceae bacterium]
MRRQSPPITGTSSGMVGITLAATLFMLVVGGALLLALWSA